MKRDTWHYVVDVFLFISMMQVIIIGVIMGFFTNSGPGVPEAEKYLWGLHRHQWGGIHTFFAILLTLFFVIHMILEWRWIKNKTRQMFKKLWMIPLILLVTAAVFFISWLIPAKNVPIEKPHKKLDHSYSQKVLSQEVADQYHDTEDMGINGRISLGDIRDMFHVDIPDLLKRLGLPADTPMGERLGQLKRIHSFSIQDVRDAVVKLQKEGEASEHE